MNLPEFKDNDVLYVYKIKHFTGFAPCFDNNTYSLACCKGNKRNGGMRRSICKRKENDSNTNVWILGIAGKELNDSLSKGYSANDMIYLAKIHNESKLYTWSDYYKKYSNCRRDAIYSLEDERIIWNGKLDQTEHKPEPRTSRSSCLNTDCSTEISKNGEKDIYENVKQIIVTEDYWIFDSGIKLPEGITTNRNFTFNENPNGKKRVQIIKDIIKKNKGKLSYRANPFNKETNINSKTCKGK